MDSLQILLHSNKSIRPTEADVELKKSAQVHATVQCSIETAIEMGKWWEICLANNKQIYITFYSFKLKHDFSKYLTALVLAQLNNFEDTKQKTLWY